MTATPPGDADHLRLRAALLAAMRPIAAVLLRFGIGYREFSEVLKAAFVDAATAEFGVRGRPTNVSRVAAMTGLARKEVRRLRELPATVMEAGPATVPASVMQRWYTDPRYAAGPGRPLDLPWDGVTPSFTSLVRECASDIPPGAVRAELRRLGIVAERPDGTLQAVRRHVVPEARIDTLLEGLTTGLRTVALTVGWNATVDQGGLRRFQRTASNRAVPASRRAEAEAVLRARLTEWTEQIDDYLAGLEAEGFAVAGDPGQGPDGGLDQVPPRAGLGIGMYYYEERPPAGD
jgi:hypothetical protein